MGTRRGPKAQRTGGRAKQVPCQVASIAHDGLALLAPCIPRLIIKHSPSSGASRPSAATHLICRPIFSASFIVHCHATLRLIIPTAIPFDPFSSTAMLRMSNLSFRPFSTLLLFFLFFFLRKNSDWRGGAKNGHKRKPCNHGPAPCIPHNIARPALPHLHIPRNNLSSCCTHTCGGFCPTQQ